MRSANAELNKRKSATFMYRDDCRAPSVEMIMKARTMHLSHVLFFGSTCNVQRATCNVQRATCNVQRATCNVQRATCNVQRATA
eukprot:scaffold470_cov194-Amphora_coffeaeformis.AAC.3